MPRSPSVPAVRLLTSSDAVPLGDFFVAAAVDPAVRRFFHPHPLTRDHAADLCRRLGGIEDRYFALFVGNRIAGYGMLRGWDEGYAVPSFGACVHPELREAGVGHALMTFAIAEAKRAGAAEMRLSVYRANTPAARLYLGYGFAYTPKGDDAWIGRLNLAAAEGTARRPLRIDRLRDWARRRDRPFRIGVWCAYGETLRPTNGIGVFVYNLIDGLLAHPDRPEVTIAVRPGDESLLAETVQKGGGRVRVLNDKSGPEGDSKTILHRLWRRAEPRALPPADASDGPFAATHRAARSAWCDVWVYPHLAVYAPIADHPSVQFVHDLVFEHFPHCFDPETVRESSRLARARSAEATVVACMSEFIAEGDVRGRLGVPAERVRMIRPAPPTDFPSAGEGDAVPNLPRPYLLYPAGLRGYKNQSVLIDALAHPDFREKLAGLDLVFTGGAELRFRDELLARADQAGLSGRVHILDCVPRERLAALYTNATATVVPSLYEQGSFPIFEALHYGCPVACSDIPSLREQCGGLGDAMIYFDPRDVRSVADAVSKLVRDRMAIRSAQLGRAAAVWNRTWVNVADDWLAVFRQASTAWAATKSAARAA